MVFNNYVTIYYYITISDYTTIYNYSKRDMEDVTMVTICYYGKVT